MDYHPRWITLSLILVQVLISNMRAEADSATDRTTAKKFDYVFLLDGSTSTGRESFEKAKNFLKTFIKRLPKGMNDYRFAIIQFSSIEIKTELDFEESIVGDDLDKIISNITFKGGKKSTLGGLETATAKFQDQGRLSYRAAMILSDGKENEKLLAEALKVDLLFMMDITSSMASIMKVMREKVVIMVQAIKKKYPAATIRIGVIGYRDEQLAIEDRFEIWEFSTNIADLKQWMKKKIVSLGRVTLNDDNPEFVIGALVKVKQRKWSAPLTRILVHIADAPSERWVENRKKAETWIKKAMETIRCRLKISKYLYLKPSHVSGEAKTLRQFIDRLKVLSNMDCKNYSLLTGENNWFVEKPIKTSNLTDIIIEQAEDTIEGISYANISNALNELGVDLIAIGISDKADSSNVQYITGATFLHYDDTNPNKTAELVTAEISKDICKNCKNGVCKNGGCECKSGFSGLDCTDIDECATNPCNHGSCQDEINGYHCNCEPGYTGTSCDTDIDECATNPCNHGRCQDKINGYHCNCESGYTGTNCDADIDECATNPCVHGSCQDEINGYHCDCKPGYTGTHCDTEDDCPPPEAKGIRLLYGDTPYDGVLQIYRGGRWYTLCKGALEERQRKNMDIVACRQLGYGKPNDNQDPPAKKDGLLIKDIYDEVPISCFPAYTDADLDGCSWQKNPYGECFSEKTIYLKCEKPTQVCSF